MCMILTAITDIAGLSPH